MRITIPALSYTWESQKRQFARKGRPGMDYEVNHVQGYPVDCLVWRDGNGTVTGILYHYPEGGPQGLEKPGAVNLLVSPRHQRRGIATKLMDEAISRWDPDFEGQDYTPEGYAFITEYERRRGG